MAQGVENVLPRGCVAALPCCDVAVLPFCRVAVLLCCGCGTWKRCLQGREKGNFFPLDTHDLRLPLLPSAFCPMPYAFFIPLDPFGPFLIQISVSALQ